MLYNKIIYIDYDNEKKIFIARIYIKYNDYNIPLEMKNIDLSNYPFLMNKLIDGNTLYIDSYDGYIGFQTTEGPYYEDYVLNSEYEVHDSVFEELLLNLNTSIKQDKKQLNKLYKIGDNYKKIIKL